MRTEGWEALLAEYVSAAPAFAWGQADCALWCADWVALATGTDFTGDWVGRYSSEAELQALLAARGLASHADIPGSVGLEEINPAFAQRGDVVLHPQGCLGICTGLLAVFLTESGLTTLRGRSRAWRV